MKNILRRLALGMAALTAAAILCACGDDVQPATVVNFMSPESLTVIPDADWQLPSPLPFCESDLTVSDSLLLGMEPEYVKSLWGAPILESAEELPGYGSGTTLTYDGCRLVFYGTWEGADDIFLSDVICKTGRIRFARGLHVGCNAKEVLTSFANDRESRPLHLMNAEEPNGKMLYGEHLGGKQHEDLYSYAYIDKSALCANEADFYAIHYCYEKPLAIYTAETEQNLCETYSLIFFIDADDDAVTEISLCRTVQPWTQAAHLPQ